MARGALPERGARRSLARGEPGAFRRLRAAGTGSGAASSLRADLIRKPDKKRKSLIA